MLKFVDTANIGPTTIEPEHLEDREENRVPVETPEHRVVNEIFDQMEEVLGRNIEGETPRDREPDQKGLKRESAENTGSIPPPPKPIIGPKTEFIFKQEWVEQCEKIRLPLKKKYQLQFNETMRLKREVRNFKRQVSWLKNKVKIYKWKAIKPKIEVSSVATHTGPIEELFEGREFVLAAKIHKW